MSVVARAMDNLDLSQAAMARLLGAHVNSVRRWKNGETDPPGPVALICSVLEKEDLAWGVELWNRVEDARARP